MISEKTMRWLAVALTVVIAVCTAGCTIAYVTHPREWVCTMAAPQDCEKQP